MIFTILFVQKKGRLLKINVKLLKKKTLFYIMESVVLLVIIYLFVGLMEKVILISVRLFLKGLMLIILGIVVIMFLDLFVVMRGLLLKIAVLLLRKGKVLNILVFVINKFFYLNYYLKFY